MGHDPDIGINIKGGRPTKGQASDLIGLFEPIDEDDKEILKFFNLPLKGLNQSRARYDILKLFSARDNVDAWEKRPATPLQREFFKFFNLKAPSKLTHIEASGFISENFNKLLKKDAKRLKEWDAYESLYEQICDPDLREEYGIKKGSLSSYRAAIEELDKEGKNLVILVDNVDVVINKIIEMNPTI